MEQNEGEETLLQRLGGFLLSGCWQYGSLDGLLEKTQCQTQTIPIWYVEISA